MTSSMYEKRNEKQGITMVWIIVKEFKTKMIEIIISGRTMWSTCEWLTKHAGPPQEVRLLKID